MGAPVELLRRMVEIPSVSGEEAALAGWLADTLPGLGFTAEVDPTGNVLGTIGPGSTPSVLLVGHLDTVPGGPPVRVAGGRLHGRGSCDAKAPFAAMICAAAEAVAAGYTGSITVAGVVEEELQSRGARALRERLPRPDALVNGEPSGWSGIVIGYKGKLDLTYQVSVPSTHPTNPAPKATELAVTGWTTLLELLGGVGTGFDQASATLVGIHGDQTTAEAQLSVRTPPGFDCDRLLAELRPRCVGELTVDNRVAACRTGRRNPVVRALSAGIRQQGGTPRLKVKSGTSDMNVLAEVWELPMATYGPGDSAQDHTDGEHLVLDEFHRGVAVLSHALLDLGEVL